MKDSKVAIIMVSFNRSDVTNLALDSIAKATCSTPYRVILVDNQSQRDEFAKMKGVFNFLVVSKKFEGTLIESPTNSGYAGGNNLGIREALADPTVSHLCLLNNDTIVTDGWLDGLVKYSSKSLVGAVSNEVGNEQVVPVPYRLLGPDGYAREEVKNFANEWKKQHLGNVVTAETMLGFFCVLGSRELFEKVGLLDEAFGVGYYEDDDFCLRCKKAGFSLSIVREVFVHHWGSASFKTLGQEKVDALMKKNKEIFEKKHSVQWQPHRNRWASSLTHEINWINRAGSEGQDGSSIKNLNEIKKATDVWIQNVSDEAFGICGRLTFVPGGRPFLQYIRDGILHRLSKPLALKPQWIRSFINFALEFIFTFQRERAAVLRKHTIQFMRNYFSFLLTARTWLRSFRLIQQHKKTSNTFIIAPIQGYTNRRQRPQHIADGIALKNNTVLWIEPEFGTLSVSEPGFISIEEQKTKNLYLLRNRGFSFPHFYVSSWAESEVTNYLQKLQAKLSPFGIQLKETTLIVQSPFWAPFAKIFPGSVIYECMDAHDSFGSATAEVLALEEQLFEESDSIIVSSTYLFERLRPRASKKPIFLIRNGCEPEHFISQSHARANPVTTGAAITVGYFGAVAEWFDCRLLAQVAQALPEIQFEIIGATARSEAIQQLGKLKNINLMGERNYAELPQLTQHWKAGLIPFQLTELILATNPVKLYEYSALGLPVVATAIPEVIESMITPYIGSTAQEFAQAILKAIREDSTTEQERRRHFAQENSWSNRALQVLEAAEMTHSDFSLKSDLRSTQVLEKNPVNAF